MRAITRSELWRPPQRRLVQPKLLGLGSRKARHFPNLSYVRCAIGSCDIAFGTIAVVFKLRGGGPSYLWATEPASLYRMGLQSTVVGVRLYVTGIGSALGPTITAADGWCLLIVSKATGNVIPRFHLYKYAAASWAHSNGDTSLPNPTGTAIRVAIGTWGGNSDGVPCSIAAAAVWNRTMADAEAETIPLSLKSWIQTSPAPVGMWVLDQESIATSVEDWTGNGANQNAILGTEVTPDAPPPALVYNGQRTFNYTGAQQTWTPPAGVTSATFDIKGAGDGNSVAGGRLVMTYPVTPGVPVYINNGGSGGDVTGGFNGGGNGDPDYGYSGGGATDIRIGGTALADRVGVAGGAGWSFTGTGSRGGGASAGTGAVAGEAGTDGLVGKGGGAGGAAAGGAGGAGSVAGSAGSLGVGGNGGVVPLSADGSGGGGGGGYYGAGGGGADAAFTDVPGGGGGGSNFAGPLATVITHTRGGGNADHGSIGITW